MAHELVMGREGFDVIVGANEDGDWVAIKAVGGAVGCQGNLSKGENLPAITLADGDVIPGPFTRLTKIAGPGQLIAFRDITT